MFLKIGFHISECSRQDFCFDFSHSYSFRCFDPVKSIFKKIIGAIKTDADRWEFFAALEHLDVLVHGI